MKIAMPAVLDPFNLTHLFSPQFLGCAPRITQHSQAIPRACLCKRALETNAPRACVVATTEAWEECQCGGSLTPSSAREFSLSCGCADVLLLFLVYIQTSRPLATGRGQPRRRRLNACGTGYRRYIDDHVVWWWAPRAGRRARGGCGARGQWRRAGGVGRLRRAAAPPGTTAAARERLAAARGRSASILRRPRRHRLAATAAAAARTRGARSGGRAAAAAAAERAASTPEVAAPPPTTAGGVRGLGGATAGEAGLASPQRQRA